MSSIGAWIVANPLVVLAIAVWLVANIAPRPHPDQVTGAAKVFWTIVDRLCVLTAAELPGWFKFPLVASPSPVVDPPAVPPPPSKGSTS